MAAANDTTEHWLRVPGYEGMYEVSDNGRIRGVSRVISGPRGDRLWAGRVLTPWVTNRGYSAVRLCRDGCERSFLVHRIVAAAFIRADIDGLQVDHVNFDRKDNRLANLRIVTASENNMAVARAGRHPSKLSPDAIREIRALSGSSTCKTIGLRFGVSAATINRVLLGRTWCHV